jgi:hypothetical protein
MTEAARPVSSPLRMVRGRRSKLATELETIGKAAAVYYRTLLDEGIPASIAKEMLLEWHQSFMGWDPEEYQ